jgi:hypothetical protein
MSYGADTTRLKKGPWSLHEDAILKEYVRNYGEGNWDAVKEKTELFRCGKSCRLRWLNHLHPNLEKVPITREEEQKIVELHAKIGPKWSLWLRRTVYPMVRIDKNKYILWLGIAYLAILVKLIFLELLIILA